MDYVALKAELDTDPEARGYSGMTDEQVVTDLNTVYRTRSKTQLTGDEVFTATDQTEFTGLSATEENKQIMWVSFTSKDSIDPTNAANIAFVDFIFGGASTTKSNLATLRTENVSRAVELFGTDVIIGDVQNARAL